MAGKSSSIFQIVISAGIALSLALLAAFWALADPRAEIKNIRENFLTIREHNEFQARVKSDISRLEDENRHQVRREEFEGRLGQILREHDAFRREIEALRDRMTEHAREDRVRDLDRAKPAH